jgi:hypothetical protein
MGLSLPSIGQRWRVDRGAARVCPMPAAAALPDDIEALRALACQHAAALSERDAEIERLREQIGLLLAQCFGASSERVIADVARFTPFNEAEADAEVATEVADADTVTVPVHTRGRGHRRPPPGELPREDIVHDPAAARKNCSHDGTALEAIGADTGEQLDIVPAAVAPCPRPCQSGLTRCVAGAAQPRYAITSVPIRLGRGYLWGVFPAFRTIRH